LFHENIHNISYELTGNELIALLLESREIKRLWPEYNRVQKFTSNNHGLYQYVDRNGYQRLTIAKIQPGIRVIMNFRSFQEGRSFVHELVRKYNLCPKLAGLQKSDVVCFDHKLGICDGACKGDIASEEYNDRFKQAMESLYEEKKTFAIVGTGREPEEKSVVLVENGVYLGHGFTDYHFPASTFEDLKDRITTYPDNQDIQKILNMHLKNSDGNQVIYF
jgi:DNA polymerase-3 subunit epsilon